MWRKCIASCIASYWGCRLEAIFFSQSSQSVQPAIYCTRKSRSPSVLQFSPTLSLGSCWFFFDHFLQSPWTLLERLKQERANGKRLPWSKISKLVPKALASPCARVFTTLNPSSTAQVGRFPAPTASKGQMDANGLQRAHQFLISALRAAFFGPRVTPSSSEIRSVSQRLGASGTMSCSCWSSSNFDPSRSLETSGNWIALRLSNIQLKRALWKFTTSLRKQLSQNLLEPPLLPSDRLKVWHWQHWWRRHQQLNTAWASTLKREHKLSGVAYSSL